MPGLDTTHDSRTADATRTMRDRGASLVEYAMLVALITVVCLAALTAFGEENDGLIDGSRQEIVEASNR